MPDKIEGKNIFITGGCGFIGSWVIKKLIGCNRVWCYDNMRRVSPVIKEMSRQKNLNIIRGDVLDAAGLKKSLPRKLDMFLHLAAIAGVSSYYKIPLETMQVNLIGTYNALEAIKGRDLDIFVDFSTSEVYGRYAKDVKESDDTIQGPISDSRWTYASSKIAAERLGHCYGRKYDIRVVSIRPFNIYGPLQVGEGAVHIFITSALRGRDLVVHGDGSQVRAWCYIEDFINGLFACIRNPAAASGNVFNIGDPDGSISVMALARKILYLSGSNSKIILKDESRTDVDYRVPDISKARRILKFRPKIGLDDGLRRTIEWYRENKF